MRNTIQVLHAHDFANDKFVGNRFIHKPQPAPVPPTNYLQIFLSKNKISRSELYSYVRKNKKTKARQFPH